MRRAFRNPAGHTPKPGIYKPSASACACSNTYNTGLYLLQAGGRYLY